MAAEPSPAGASVPPVAASTATLASAAPELARELRGDLPCARCRYNLKGISVTDRCPECGTPVRVTILARVDPYAPVLRPISWPWATAAGVTLWVLGALIAALAAWVMRLRDVAQELDVHLAASRPLVVLGVAGLLASAVGALALIRPHAGLRRGPMLGAAMGMFLLLVAAWCFWHIHGVLDPIHVKPYLNVEVVVADRSIWRLAMSAALAGALLGFRPNARLLASRSLLLRMGRVDRQHMLAMVAAIGVTAVGDLLHLTAAWAGSGPAQLMIPAGTFVIAVGSVMLTVGLLGALVDCTRIAPVLARPIVSMSSLLEAPAAAGPPQGRGTPRPAPGVDRADAGPR